MNTRNGGAGASAKWAELVSISLWVFIWRSFVGACHYPSSAVLRENFVQASGRRPKPASWPTSELAGWLAGELAPRRPI